MFSAVRAGSSQIGFVKDMQRLNVAITRAKHALIVICDVRAMESNEGWRNLIRSANVRGLLSHVPVASNMSFKQQIEHFLSKSSPFAVSAPPAQRQKVQEPHNHHQLSSSSSDPRLQPTLQINSCVVPLPPSLHSPAPHAANAASAFRNAAPASGVSQGVHDAVGTVPRPQKRAASPPNRQQQQQRETPPKLQHQHLQQPSQQRLGEQRVADRAIAEQERQRHIQEMQQVKDNRAPSPTQYQQQLPRQHQEHVTHQQLPSQHLQPPLKRERLNDQPPLTETVSASARGGSVAFVPAVYNAFVPSTPAISHVNSHPPCKPPPPPGAPPIDPNQSPLKEQILSVERLFAVSSLLAYVFFMALLAISINSSSHRALVGHRSWTVPKTNAIASALSLALHADMQMTYDYEV